MRRLGLGVLCAWLAVGCTVTVGGGDEDGGTSESSGGSGGGGSGGSGGSDDDAGEEPELDAGPLDAGPVMTAVDPAPEADTPGEHGCDGCPDSDVTTFEINAGASTVQSFTGTVTGADGDGTFYIESSDGQAISGAIATSDSGAYAFTAPLFCGAQLVKLVWSNDEGKLVVVIEAITEECVSADIRITLTWDALGSDFELHLIKEGGQINDSETDCTWTTCLSGTLDWGVAGDASDNPTKDVDNTGSYGPENIYYPMPEDGTYTVMVEHWGAGDPGADGQVTINVLGEEPVVVDIPNLASHHVFNVATIDWPSKTVDVVADDFDCSANWSAGCLEAIP